MKIGFTEKRKISHNKNSYFSIIGINGLLNQEK